jgi:hypothetical protein
VAARHKGILTIMYTCGGSSEITGSLFVRADDDGDWRHKLEK